MSKYREVLSQKTVAISISDSPDMHQLGLSEAHLQDAMVEIARHLLALGSRLVYGGDLRPNGFTEILFELVARHRRDADAGDGRAAIQNFLAWPVHIGQAPGELQRFSADLAPDAELVCIDERGNPTNLENVLRLPREQATPDAWQRGLTQMRQAMLKISDARVVLGGRTENYKGAMPGIAEEALLSLQARQPIYLLGGFGGCTRDITESLGLADRWSPSSREWRGRENFRKFDSFSPNNGLSSEENAVLAKTPHIDQAVTLVLTGLLKAQQKGA